MMQPLAVIIEDDPKLADIFALSMESAGYQCEVIADGNAALARLAEVAPDVVVLDLHLAHVSGEDILRFIRAGEHLANIHVILATADAALADRLGEQVDLVLLKPISPFQLRDLAKRLHMHITS
jgi:CheY-like chemotaxis protein